MIDKLNEYYYKVEAYFKANPKHAWILAGVVLLIFGIGSLLGKKWAVDPGSSRQRGWYNFIGGKWFGRITGFIFIIGAAACFALAFFL